MFPQLYVPSALCSLYAHSALWEHKAEGTREHRAEGTLSQGDRELREQNFYQLKWRRDSKKNKGEI